MHHSHDGLIDAFKKSDDNLATFSKHSQDPAKLQRKDDQWQHFSIVHDRKSWKSVCAECGLGGGAIRLSGLLPLE